MEKNFKKNINSQFILFWPLIILSILAISIFVFYGVNNSFWFDEVCSINTASYNFNGIILDLKNGSTPPFYYIILAIWIKIFGISELTVRSLSGIFYLFSLIAIYALGKSVYNKKTGLVCSFLYMLSPVAIMHAQNARMYSLLALLSIFSTLFFLKTFFTKTKSKGDFILFIVFNILGVFTHYWFFFIILSQIVAYLLLFRKSQFKKFILAICVSVTPFLLLWLPIFLQQLGSNAWMNKPKISQLVYSLLNFFALDVKEPKLPTTFFSFFIYSAFFVLTIFNLKNGKIKFRNFHNLKKFIVRKQNLVFLIFLAVSLLTPFIISQKIPIYLTGRYTIIALFPFILLIGSLVSKFGNKFIVLICCYILLIATAADFISYKNIPQGYSDKLTAQYLIQYADNNDIIIFTSLSKAAIDYYINSMHSPKNFTKITFPSEIESHPAWRDAGEMLSQPSLLEKEADKIVNNLNALVKNNNTKIWLTYGYDNEINKIFKNKLDNSFILMEEKKLQGSFYNKIFVYQNRLTAQ